MANRQTSSGLRIGIDARNLTSPISGIGRYVYELCRELDAAGHHVVLYMPQKPQVDFRAMPSCNARIGRFKGPILRQIWAHSILPLAVRKDSLDVFWGPAHRLPPFLPVTLPRVVTIHDLVWLHAPQTMRLRTRLGERAFMRSSVLRADTIVTDSDATGRDLAEAMPSLNKNVQTIYPGVTLLPPFEMLDISSVFCIDKPYVLYVGTLEPRKNLLGLLDAWAMLPEATRGTYLLVLAGGKGWGMGNIAKEIADRNLATSVRQVGYVTDGQLSTLYSKATMLAMPSLYEGFGLPIVESNSHGVPALTSNLSCMPEIAGPNAIYVNPASSTSIADGLESVLSGKIEWRPLSDAARLNAQRFSWRTTAGQLIGAFELAIKMRKRS